MLCCGWLRPTGGRRRKPFGFFRSVRPQRAPSPKASNSTGDVLEIVHESADAGASSAWGFPPGFLSQAWGIASGNLRMVALTTSAEEAGMGAGDRALIDCNDVLVRDGATFAVQRKNGSIALLRGRTGGRSSSGPTRFSAALPPSSFGQTEAVRGGGDISGRNTLGEPLVHPHGCRTLTPIKLATSEICVSVRLAFNDSVWRRGRDSNPR
jgi:hypothetical protein